MIKIAHFIYDNTHNSWLAGGGACREHEINQRLVKKNFEIHVFCGASKNKKADWVENGVNYHVCGNSFSYVVSRLTYALVCRSRFKKINRRIGFDLVVDDTSAFSFSGPWLVWKGKIIGIVHHIVGDHAKKKFGVFGGIFSAWEKFNLRKFSELIAVSEDTANQLIQIVGHNTNVNIVRNGISDSAFVERHLVRKPFQLLYLGRIEIYNKGLDDLLVFFKRILEDDSRYELAIVGGGKDSSTLLNEVKRHEYGRKIRVVGRVEEFEKWEWLQTAAVLLMPSRYEGWGIVAIEAAACGCPVLGRNIDGLREAIKIVKGGILIDDFRETSINVLENVKNIKPLFPTDFSWDNISNQVESIYLSYKELF